MNYIAVPFYIPDLVGSTVTQRVSLRLHICGNGIDYDRKDPLRMACFADHLGVRFFEQYVLADYIEYET